MKTVVVLTMPRSGSSLLAGMLHRLGVWMGPEADLEIGKQLNQNGCQEHQGFVRWNENLFLKAGWLADQSRRAGGDDTRMVAAANSARPQFENLLKENRREIWGFKAAGLIYGLPFVHDLIENPHYVVLRRDPDAVADSVARAARSGNGVPVALQELSYFSPLGKAAAAFQFAKVLLTRGNPFKDLGAQKAIAEDGLRRIDEFVEGERHLEIELPQLVGSPRDTLAGLAEFLQISPGAESVASALAFLDPSLIAT